MVVTPPKCKFCPHLHWGLCPTIGAAPPRVRVLPAQAKKPPAPKLLPAPKKEK